MNSSLAEDSVCATAFTLNILSLVSTLRTLYLPIQFHLICAVIRLCYIVRCFSYFIELKPQGPACSLGSHDTYDGVGFAFPIFCFTYICTPRITIILTYNQPLPLPPSPSIVSYAGGFRMAEQSGSEAQISIEREVGRGCGKPPREHRRGRGVCLAPIVLA